MNDKQYPLHHDHGTVTISRDVFDSMTAELERLRPMETGLELAEADCDAYKKRAEELAGKYKELAKDHDNAIQACWISPKEKLPAEGQEVEFVAQYTSYASGNTYRKRFQGHFQKVNDTAVSHIFYAHSIGWGCEFLIDEVECWMPKVPMPEEKK
jgi:hypothetical protein